jgi:large subunit ribosomal protein L14
MIQKQTILTVADNSGIKKVQCIHIYNKKSTAKIGDKILVTIKQGKSKTNLSKGALLQGVIVRTKFSHKTKSNNYLAFEENSLVLINKQNQPISTRILGPIPMNFRNNKKFKIISLGAILI